MFERAIGSFHAELSVETCHALPCCQHWQYEGVFILVQRTLEVINMEDERFDTDPIVTGFLSDPNTLPVFHPGLTAEGASRADDHGNLSLGG